MDNALNAIRYDFFILFHLAIFLTNQIIYAFLFV